MSVRRLRGEIDNDELIHWMAYDSICPIGDSHSDFLAAFICQIHANRTGGKGGDGNTPFSLKEFLIDFWENKVVEEGPSPEELWNRIQHLHAMATAHNQAKLMREAQQNG